MKIKALLPTILLLGSSYALASSVTYTSSTAFLAALGASPTITENYGAFSAGQLIPNGSTFNGITYTSFSLAPGGTGGIISNQFNSFSGLSLGANQSGAQFFFDGNSLDISFAQMFAIGVFFNVNQNSGTFGINTSAGNVSTGSAAYDTSTFVFAGLISTTPFTSATIFSNSSGAGTASFNIPEIILESATPEPWSITMTAVGGGFLAGLRLLRRKAAKQS